MARMNCYQTVAGYSDQFRREREAVQARAEREAEERREENQRFRDEHLAGLATQRAEEHKLEERRLDALLEPEKQRRKRQWLADHPDKSESDFERHAWPQLRVNLVEEMEAADEKEIEMSLRRTGRYSF